MSGYIFDAVTFGNKGKVEEYVRNKGNVNARDSDGNTLLMIAAKKGWYGIGIVDKMSITITG